MTVRKALLLPVLMIGGIAANTDAQQQVFRTINTELRWGNLVDYVRYLGPAGSTNPNYAVGHTMVDYFGNAEQPDGTFLDPEIDPQDIDGDVSTNVPGLVVYKTDPNVYIYSTWSLDRRTLGRSASLPVENAFFSFNINVLGQDIWINTLYDSVRATSFQDYYFGLSPSSKLTLKRVFTVPDPTLTLTIPALVRHINANAGNWYRNPGTFEVINSESMDRQLSLKRITIEFIFDGIVIEDLNILDLTDPATVGLITGTRLELSFEDNLLVGSTDGGYARIQYEMEPVPSPGNDLDQDGIDDSVDNCPLVANVDQLNTDGASGGGDVCDSDDDNDSRFDVDDNCPLIPNPNQEDDDIDGIGNACDPDYVPPCVGCDCPA
jgi:hypothetical protein